jgi:ubiquinone/menaquinone biosynthesis C-methylase UbiE
MKRWIPVTEDGPTAYTTSQSQREFANWSRRYDRDPLQWLFFRPTHRRILRQIRTTDLRILDIGCGTGQFAAKVIRSFPEAQLIGLDLCDSMLHKARSRSGGRFALVRADSQKLPFADDSFDIVTCSHSFHHYPDQPRVVEEMYRVLRPGGRLFIADGDRDGLWGRLIFDGIVVAIEGAVKHLPLADFRELLSRSGFEAIEQSRRGGLLPFAITMGTAAKLRVQRRRAG